MPVYPFVHVTSPQHARTGLVAPLVREVRLGNRASLAPALALLLDIMKAAPPPGTSSNSDSDSRSSTAPDSAHEAVGTGLLSLCAQLLFQVRAGERSRAAKTGVVSWTQYFRPACLPVRAISSPHAVA
jgi:hypothetical protein